MAFEKVHMLRCAPFASLRPTKKVGLTLRYSYALPLKLFETPYLKYVGSECEEVTPHSEGLARRAPEHPVSGTGQAFERHI